MDATDRNILAELQKDGRLSVKELSERVGLSLSPCHRRLRALEQEEIITGYRANIDHVKVGLGFAAIVFVTLREGSSKSVQSFEAALLDFPEVIHAERLFGDPDYMLRVVTRDLAAFQTLYDRHLSAMPCVLRLTSTLVMKSIFENRLLPL